MTNTIPLSSEQVRWFRLKRSGLVDPFSSPEAAASALIGIQAQIEPAAGLALWNRTRGLTLRKFEDLIYTDRTLVKLWGSAGEGHFVHRLRWPILPIGDLKQAAINVAGSRR